MSTPGRAAPMARPYTRQGRQAAARLQALVQSNPPGVALADLARLRRDLDRGMAALVEVMRAEGASWSQVGRVLGTTRQAATQRFGRGRGTVLAGELDLDDEPDSEGLF